MYTKGYEYCERYVFRHKGDYSQPFKLEIGIDLD